LEFRSVSNARWVRGLKQLSSFPQPGGDRCVLKQRPWRFC
jgi:hypothetical protein